MRYWLWSQPPLLFQSSKLHITCKPGRLQRNPTEAKLGKWQRNRPSAETPYKLSFAGPVDNQPNMHSWQDQVLRSNDRLRVDITLWKSCCFLESSSHLPRDSLHWMFHISNQFLISTCSLFRYKPMLWSHCPRHSKYQESFLLLSFYLYSWGIW